MKKFFFTLLICSVFCMNIVNAQRATQATIVYWDAAQSDQVLDNITNFKFNNNQLLVELSDGSATAINIADIRKITLAATNSIESFDENCDILIYPNPVSEQLHFACANQKEIVVSIYTMNGQLLIQQQMNTTETMDVTNLPTGMYVIKINNFAYKFNKL